VAGVLIAMKLTLMRRSLGGARASWVLTGASVGLLLAAGTIALATLDYEEPAALPDLLAVVFAIWALGWMVGPAFGGEPMLRPEHFALEPVPRGSLAVGLLAAAFVGITTAVTVLAFTAIVVYGARLGPPAVAVAIPALALQLTLVVILSRLTARLFGALARSRTGAAITALLTATMIVLSQSGWVVFVALETVLVTGFSDTFSTVVRAFPSSWGLLAVEASGRGDWAAAGAALLALAALVAALVALWARLLAAQPPARPVVRGSAGARAARSARIARGGLGAVYVKELRTWLRDPLRVQSLVMAPAFAVLTGLLPLLFDSTTFLPFVGALTALMGAIASANLYGQDGTALWLTLVTPGSERADVRGRQLAWLTLFGPLAFALTVAGGALHGDPALWPWALAATIALLGGGAGLLALVAVDQLVPGPDPHRITNSPLDHGDVTGQAFAMLFLASIAAAPALGAVLAGELADDQPLRWSGLPVAVLTGVTCFVLLGNLAARRLRTRGPELLFLMRTGADHDAPGGAGASPLQAMPRHRRSLLWTSVLVGCIALFPQGLVPLAMKLADDVARVWFLALYMPEHLQWPTIALMLVLGAAALSLALWIYRSELKRHRIGRAASRPRTGREG
jgi:ABC-2 type transport system permease protein